MCWEVRAYGVNTWTQRCRCYLLELNFVADSRQASLPSRDYDTSEDHVVNIGKFTHLFSCCCKFSTDGVIHFFLLMWRFFTSTQRLRRQWYMKKRHKPHLDTTLSGYKPTMCPSLQNKMDKLLSLELGLISPSKC